ncbi:MAG: putative metal-binding motif-containing protein [Nannocystaceae bacterium]
MTLSTCPSCAGFLPPAATSCPHCGCDCAAPPPASRVAGKLFAAASGGLMALTLMACYGGPPVEPCDDEDNDGYYANSGLCGSGSPNDCDDNNAAIHPGADDPVGDDIDQNCDGVDGVAPATSTTDASTTDASTTDAGTTDASTTADTTGA